MEDHDLSPRALGFDAVDAGLVMLDSDHVIRAWNAWMAAASGIPPADAIGKRLLEAIAAPLPPRLLSAIKQAIESGASSMLTHALNPALFPIRSSTGQPLIHNVIVSPVSAVKACCLVQIFDVSAATQREQILRERQNARYDAVVDSAPEAIVTVDGDGVIQWINRAAERGFGYSSRELIGRPLDVLFHSAAGLSGFVKTLVRGMPLGGPIELSGRRKDGSSLSLEVSGSAWKSQGQPFVTAILRDISERKMAELALRRLNQTLESKVAERTAERDRMWRLSSDVMLVTGLDGVITAANPASSLLLGTPESQLVGASMKDIVLPDDWADWAAEVRSISENGTRRLFAVRVRTSEGKHRWIEWSAAAGDQLVHAVGRDITAEKEAEVALRSAEDALRQSQKMEAIGQLTGGIAHDFNNLLAGVIGALEIAKRKLATARYDELPRFMDAGIASAQRAAALTHRLLAFARQQPLDPRPHDVNQLIIDMEDLLQRSLGEQVSLRTQLGEDLGFASTDGNQLENAILNLVINARDAMPDGGSVTISTYLTDVAPRGPLVDEGLAPGRYVSVAVTDTGTGMPEDVAAKAFDPFFTTKPIGKGTGLGLSMIYGFAKQSQGHARIETEIGAGTTVTLYLPQSAEGSTALSPGSPVSAPRGAGEIVLVVEDDSSVRLLITEVLHELGYTAIEVSDGRSALPILTSDARIDLMISDVGLPGLDGKKLADIARQHRPNLPVLFVTGYAEHAKVRGEFLGAGMDMVTKPFAIENLGHKIRDMLSRSLG
jgi:PAS domain S-box-containing protein